MEMVRLITYFYLIKIKKNIIAFSMVRRLFITNFKYLNFSIVDFPMEILWHAMRLFYRDRVVFEKAVIYISTYENINKLLYVGRCKILLIEIQIYQKR